MLDKMLDYLNARGVDIIKRGKSLEISEHEDVLAGVAGAWEDNKDAIRAVIQARCDVLREKLIVSDQPYEVVISRQCLVELAGILEDFELYSVEFGSREAGKTKSKPEKKT